MFSGRSRLQILAAVAAVAAQCAAAAEDDVTTAPGTPAAAHELPQVVVIGNTPLSGLGLPLNYVPSNVQTLNSNDLRRQQSLDLTDFLNNNFSGINISESQDNPLQPDVNYHGFTASPLLGTPEGLSVYVDGVRVNEAFGDTVNWDLIPESAISTVTLQSGSNPIFGLNTLGGALVVQTKNGRDNPGTEIEAYGGSFGRRKFVAETGGELGALNYFFTASYFDENGWRDLSPTHAYQAFGKIGWSSDKTDINVSYTYADSSMIGNGTTPQSMLDYRSESIYSAPDFTHNLLNFVNGNLAQHLTDTLLLSGNVYFRQLATMSNNGDVNDDNYLSDDYDGPDIDCTGTLGSLTDFAYCANGINRSSRLLQRTTGGSLQLTESHDLFGMKNQAVLGGTLDHSTDSYAQTFQYANLTPQRTALSFASPFNPAVLVNSLSGENQIFGVYLTDTFSPSDLLHFTASVRYNRSKEVLNGLSVDTDVGDDAFNTPDTLREDHVFAHVNPSFGFTVTPSDSLTLFADWNQSSRTPTVIELGCSDPENPCGLPNDFASDPDLKQVISRTVEAGARGTLLDRALNWSVDLYHTVNNNDIQFVATTTSEGYFANVGNTRRQGLDLQIGGKVSQLTWNVVYSYVDATYQSNFLINGESNSSANDDGNIQVTAGNRIPLIPRHTGRLVLDYAVTKDWNIGARIITASGSFLHGDENNANQPNGDDVVGSGWISGYTLVNLDTTYSFSKYADVFLRINNVFDKRYATAGFLTSNSFNPNGSFRADPDTWSNENGVSPGAPRAAWIGARVHF